MPINYPRLDDRTFDKLLASSIIKLKALKPEWSGVDISDPGIVLLELFAYLTEEVLYRLNKLPEKTYAEFLNLLEATQNPPSAAYTTLCFSRKDPNLADRAIEIPAHTKISLRSEVQGAPVFLTLKDAVIKAGESSVASVRAAHCEFVENEKCPNGNGQSGFTVTVKNKPIVVDPLGELKVAVAVESNESVEGATPLFIDGKFFLPWEECRRKGDLNCDRRRFLVDRYSGLIRFPINLYTHAYERGCARAGLSHGDKEIRVSYYHGGGSAGNVSKGSLTTILTPELAELLDVTNEIPSCGGRDAETVAELIQRGPELIHSTERLVTAQDYNIEIAKNRGIAQVATYAKSEIWSFAERGTVQVSLVPSINLAPWDQPEIVTSDETLFDSYRVASDETLMRHIVDETDAKKVLGVATEYQWANIKPVAVHATIITYPRQDRNKIRRSILKALYAYFAIEPNVQGSSYLLSVSNTVNTAEIYSLMMGIKGVRHVSKLSLRLPLVPDRNVRSVERCPYMRGYYVASAEDGLYFSVNDGSDWNRMLDTSNETMVVSRVNIDRSGCFACVTHVLSEDKKSVLESKVRCTVDNGKIWLAWTLTMSVNDCSWVSSADGAISLVLAADKGLYWLDVREKSLPLLIKVGGYTGGFYSVRAAMSSVTGELCVAASAMNCAGVYVAFPRGDSHQWDTLPVILQGRDVRALVMEVADARIWLWVGVTTTGDQNGEGCFRYEATAKANIAKTLEHYKNGWIGGSCRCIFIKGDRIYAGTHRRGVLFMNRKEPGSSAKALDPRWESMPLECGLPLRDVDRLFVPVNALESGPDGGIMAGTDAGIYAGTCISGIRQSFKCLSSKARYANVTVPRSWFFCSALHHLTMEEFREY